MLMQQHLMNLGFNKARMNACGYSLGSTFSPNWMDWPMLYTGNPYVSAR
jgi:Xaa-Pro dipeptidase